jgi:hypothetical protein
VKEPNRSIVCRRPVFPFKYVQQWPSLVLCLLVSSWLTFCPCAINFVTCIGPMSLRKQRTYKCYLHFPVACLLYGPVRISSTKRRSVEFYFCFVLTGPVIRISGKRPASSLLCWNLQTMLRYCLIADHCQFFPNCLQLVNNYPVILVCNLRS